MTAGRSQFPPEGNSMIDYSKHQNLPWLENSLLFLTKHGSHAYGLNTASSDLDIKGVCCPPEVYFTGAFETFEQAEGKDLEKNMEYVIYDIRKFIKLAAECNPNIIELLWTDDSDLLMNTEEGTLLRSHKRDFLSTKARYTFAGYAIAQLKRIKTHRKWLLNPPKQPKTREELGLPGYEEIPKARFETALASIQKRLETYPVNFDDFDYADKIKIQDRVSNMLTQLGIDYHLQFKAAGTYVGFDSNLIEILQKEQEYKNNLNEYKQYENWKATRNPARAALEEKYGLDTKHASHLVRLLKMCEEILLTGEVVVKRPDRDELLGIKNGLKTYDEIIEWASEQEKKLNEFYVSSKLPRSVDREKINHLCMTIVKNRLQKGK